ncbi:hypothetical protein AVEN_192710-1 [Araneus ventricosus]|uniref:Uncharacterized protein n=1 Tax=Araneus ventricosus TaxID=182803 RepID=A0A4Y2UDJ1_ARAVE|nr:hypothetical protein AVEN_192710-1 [Araneus ventricosus]
MHVDDAAENIAQSTSPPEPTLPVIDDKASANDKFTSEAPNIQPTHITPTFKTSSLAYPNRRGLRPTQGYSQLPECISTIRLAGGTKPISDSEIKAVLSQLFKTDQWLPPAGHVSEDVTSHA